MRTAPGLCGALAFLLTSCGPAQPAGKDEAVASASNELVVAPRDPPVVRQTIYVPAYPSVSTADSHKPYELAVTLTIRNTDRETSIVVAKVAYYDGRGKVAREFLPKGAIVLAPMASTQFFVKESDTSGGPAASFLIEWEAGRVVSEPIAESVMIGTMGSQGISFLSAGRVVHETKLKAAEAPAKAN